MDVQWPLVFFTLWSGLGVGAFSCVAVMEWLGVAQEIRMQGAVTALIALALGSVISFFHLSHPLRVYHIIKCLRTGVGKEMLLIGSTAFFICLYILLSGASFRGTAINAAAALGLVSGVILAFEMGGIYVLPARPAWNTWFLPCLYAASAASMGLYAMLIWAVFHEGNVREVVIQRLNQAALTSLIVLGGSILAYIIFLKSAPHTGRERRPARILSGDLAIPFWAGTIFAGLLAPVATSIYIGVVQGAHHELLAAITGLVGLLIGGISLRAIMYRLGSEADPMLS